MKHCSLCCKEGLSVKNLNLGELDSFMTDMFTFFRNELQDVKDQLQLETMLLVFYMGL